MSTLLSKIRRLNRHAITLGILSCVATLVSLIVFVPDIGLVIFYGIYSVVIYLAVYQIAGLIKDE